nr:Uncharacterised protein [Raoultella sp. NCTC 9187]
MASAISSPPSAGISAARSVCHFSPARSPASQVRIASSVCSSRIRTAAVTADAKAESATPHRVMRSGVMPPRPEEASSITAPNSSPAPQAAVSGRPNAASPRPSAEVATTASDAPALRPRICGSPSGLRITVCSSMPAMPSAAPVSSAAARRTRRKSTIIRWSKLCGS